jgi:hypothetical protein
LIRCEDALALGDEDFALWFFSIMSTVYADQEKLYLPADGAVLEVNDLGYKVDSVGQYHDSQVAVKFGPWASKSYKSKIKSIIVQQRNVYCCCKVEIEPVMTADGCMATVINVYNPSHLIKHGLTVGKEIPFRRQSGTINVLAVEELKA